MCCTNCSPVAAVPVSSGGSSNAGGARWQDSGAGTPGSDGGGGACGAPFQSVLLPGDPQCRDGGAAAAGGEGATAPSGEGEENILLLLGLLFFISLFTDFF